MAINQNAAASIVFKHAKPIIDAFANDLYEKRKETAASVCRSEEERQEVIKSENKVFSSTLNNTQIIVDEAQEEESYMTQLVDEGKPTPVTKGRGAKRIEIDGSEGDSQSVYKGYVLDGYGWDATNFKEETFAILNTTSPDLVSGVIPEAKAEIANELVKPAILEEIQQLGGEL